MVEWQVGVFLSSSVIENVGIVMELQTQAASAAEVVTAGFSVTIVLRLSNRGVAPAVCNHTQS